MCGLRVTDSFRYTICPSWLVEGPVTLEMKQRLISLELFCSDKGDSTGTEDVILRIGRGRFTSVITVLGRVRVSLPILCNTDTVYVSDPEDLFRNTAFPHVINFSECRRRSWFCRSPKRGQTRWTPFSKLPCQTGERRRTTNYRSGFNCLFIKFTQLLLRSLTSVDRGEGTTSLTWFLFTYQWNYIKWKDSKGKEHSFSFPNRGSSPRVWTE